MNKEQNHEVAWAIVGVALCLLSAAFIGCLIWGFAKAVTR